MELKCAVCGGYMEIAGDIPVDVNIRCPHCGEYVRKNKPHRIKVPTGDSLSRFIPADAQDKQTPERRKPDLHIRRPQPMATSSAPPTVPPSIPPLRSAPKKKGGSGDWAIYALLAAIVIGFVFYWRHKAGEVTDDELISSQSNATSISQDANDSEWQRRQEENRKQEEAERERRRAEKAKREAEREQERKAIALKAERERQLRATINEVELSFNGAESVFASDFPVGQRPFDFAEDGVLTVADESYVGARALHLLIVEGRRLKSVQRISQRDGAEELVPDEFMRSMTNKIVLVKMESGPVWICGKTKMSELIKVPDSTGTYSPLPDFMGEALPVLNALRAVAPSVKYRVSLKTRDGRDEIKMGIVEKGIDMQAIRSKIREQLTDQKLRTAGSGIKPPKMRKYRRTVVFYEGERIFKAIGGITKIPRTFRYFGTSRSGNNKAHVSDIIDRERKKWESLCEEARRQEEAERAVEAENQRRMDEYRRKADALLRDCKPTEREVDDELAKYRLLIERSRTKLRKDKTQDL